MASNPLVLASYSGIAMRPGISRNRRLYTREVTARMVARAQERLADPDGLPLTMLTHHDAEDDSMEIVGRVTSLSMDKAGAVHFTADLAATETARNILGLIEPDAEGRQFLRGVSIRGYWLGPVRQESGPDGLPVETGDDLELDGLDFTKDPGVPGARVDTVQRTDPAQAAPTESAGGHGRTVIHESVQEALVDTTPIREESPIMTTPAPTPATEAAEATAAARVQYADNGYTGNGQRYPLSTPSETVDAWYAFTQESVSGQYSPAQLKRARQRIGRALESHGITATAGVLSGPVRSVSESSVLEMFGDDSGAFCVELTNGPICVRVSSWYIEAADLPAIGKAAMDGAISALLAIDPDMDGDADPEGTDDEAAESAPVGDAVTETNTDPAAADVAETPDPATDPAAATTGEEPAMAEPTTPAAGATAAAPGVNLTADQFEQLLARIGGAAPTPAAAAPAESAPAGDAQVAEAAAPAAPVAVTETEEQRIDRLVAERVTAAIQSHAEAGGVTRKGLVPGGATTETAAGGEFAGSDYGLPADWPQKPLHTYSDAERAKYLLPGVEQAVMGTRSVYRQP